MYRRISIANLPGDPPDAKLCILDIYVLFNDNSYINLEMQVEDQKNWVPRSLTYLSREFDQLKHGDDYTLVKPVYHVGFLNFTLFEDHPEFHATYRLQNIRDGYTRVLILSDSNDVNKHSITESNAL